jgi:hypothetical protein
MGQVEENFELRPVFFPSCLKTIAQQQQIFGLTTCFLGRMQLWWARTSWAAT